MRFILRRWLRRLFLWVWRGVLGLVLIVALLLAPVGYTELVCQSDARDENYTSLVGPEWVRLESRTLMTYPEWHIVHAYDDYAKVIATNDPHDFGYVSAVRGFWSSLCDLGRSAGNHGGFDSETKLMVYVIGVSFSFELGLKAAYEETVGRLFTVLRGKDRSPLDDVSAAQASAYAKFLQQVPWYQWDFRKDKAELIAQNSRNLRDWERRMALGLEYSAKAVYGGVIADAVASAGYDALRMRSVVTGVTPAALKAVADVDIVAEIPEGILIETPRYRAFTHIAIALADVGADFIEIAGNDDIMFTAVGDMFEGPVLAEMERQGYGDKRALILLPVAQLADRLRNMTARVEHIHDF
jgi:hypothetical protein